MFSWLDGAESWPGLLQAPCWWAGARTATVLATRLAQADWKVLALGLVLMAAANLFCKPVHAHADAVAQRASKFGWLPQAGQRCCWPGWQALRSAWANCGAWTCRACVPPPPPCCWPVRQHCLRCCGCALDLLRAF